MLGYVGWHVWLLLRSLGVQGSSQQPHDLPTFPRPSAQGLSPQGVCCILPRGVSSEPWCFCPLMQPGPKFQFTRGQGTRERTLHNNSQYGYLLNMVIKFTILFNGVYSPSNPFAFDSPQTHCIPWLVCPTTPCVSRPSIFLVLIRPQSLLVHSPLNPSRSLALKAQNLDVLPTDASCCKASACRGPRWAKTTTILSPWSDSRAWWVTRVGFLSISVRPGVLMTPTRFANHAQPSDQRICVVVVLWCHGP